MAALSVKSDPTTPSLSVDADQLRYSLYKFYCIKSFFYYLRIEQCNLNPFYSIYTSARRYFRTQIWTYVYTYKYKCASMCVRERESSEANVTVNWAKSGETELNAAVNVRRKLQSAN